MKKPIALLLSLALLASLLSGCAAGVQPVPTEAPNLPAETAAVPTEAPIAATEEPASPEETEPSGTENCGFYEETEERGHYVFQPKVCSSIMTETFGEAMTETWFSLVDAVMAGEDSFSCPDEDTYWWVMGQYPDRCFPVLKDLIYYGEDVDHPVKDGVAQFTYTVPKEEAAARIADFAALVEGILNETLRDGDSDFEKALALYLYFGRHYIYDYDSAGPDVAPTWLSAYRVLTTGTGICQEFSVAYSYLLLQAGVDASVASGHRSFDGEPHQWSFVKLNGQIYHIDPTFVVCDVDSLSYFLMNDEQRAETGFPNYRVCSHYAEDHPQPVYAADDDTFRALWRGVFAELDRGSDRLSYSVYDWETDRSEIETFDYAGW